jgi:hypothetical protein
MLDQQDNRHLYGEHGPIAPPMVARAAPVNCFAPDTAIATMMGERALDSLAPGQMILTNSGPRLPQISNRTQKATAMVCCVPAGAFGPNVPLHDLWLSPEQILSLRLDHSVPGRKPVMHRLSDLLAHFNDGRGPDLRLKPMPQTVIHLSFAQPTVVYMAGLPVYIGEPDL